MSRVCRNLVLPAQGFFRTISPHPPGIAHTWRKAVAKKVLKSLASGRQTGAGATENGAPARGAMAADIIIKNAPDPVFVSDLEGKILQANDAVSELLGFRPDEVVEQSLSRFISEEETREFTAALKEVVAKGVTRDARLNPRSASGGAPPTTPNPPAPRAPRGRAVAA